MLAGFSACPSRFRPGRKAHLRTYVLTGSVSESAAGKRGRRAAPGAAPARASVAGIDRPTRAERLDLALRMQRLPDTEVELELHPGLLLVQLVRKRDVDYAPFDDGPCALPSAQVVEQFLDELRLVQPQLDSHCRRAVPGG